MIQTINIIGSGNVAHYLGLSLKNAVEIRTVFSRDQGHAQELAKKVDSRAISKISDLDDEVDLNIICLPDHVICEIQELLPKHIPVVHTSGMCSIDLLKGFNEFGVLYPLQTISEKRISQIVNPPFLIEANNDQFSDLLELFVSHHLSSNVSSIDSQKRQKLHLAAVYANNFTNHLLSISEKMLMKEGFDLKLFKPLLMETVSKALEMGAEKAQTGPDKRKDANTIATHLELIDNENWKEIYRVLTKGIQEKHD